MDTYSKTGEMTLLLEERNLNFDLATHIQRHNSNSRNYT